MPRKPLPLRIDGELFDRVEVRRKELGQTRTLFVERALEAALGAAGGTKAPESTLPHGGQSSLASPRAPKTTAKKPEALDEIRESLKGAAKGEKASGLPSIAPRHWAP